MEIKRKDFRAGGAGESALAESMLMMNMSEPIIAPKDEASHMQGLADYDAAMRDFYTGPVPMCHFTPMDYHECDSDPSGRSDGYQCRHCGSTVDSDKAWAKIKSRDSGLSKSNDLGSEKPSI